MNKRIITMTLLLLVAACQMSLAKVLEEPETLSHRMHYMGTCVVKSCYNGKNKMLEVEVEATTNEPSSVNVLIYKDGQLVSQETCMGVDECFEYDFSGMAAGNYDVYVEEKDGVHYVQSLEVEEDSK